MPKKAIWFDMDGTIYNLYKIDGWLEKLRAGDMSVFSHHGAGRRSLRRIRELAVALREHGWQVGIITWAPMGITAQDPIFCDCRNTKYNWVRDNCPELMGCFFCLEYGTPKASAIANLGYTTNVLVDDNKLVRAQWRENEGYSTINAAKGYIKKLEGLLG